MDVILVLNAGSSSLKFQIFRVDESVRLERLIKGQMSGVATAPRLRAEGRDEKQVVDQSFAPEEIANVGAAIEAVAGWLRKQHGLAPMAVGHRVVHGGPLYSQPILIDQDALSRLEKFVPLAPLHQPHNLHPIRMLLARFPELPQVACFDTAFHRDHDPLADHFAIPIALHAEGVRRYGFHGLSYEYISGRLREIAPGISDGRVIVAHLGSGASMCALRAGRSVESSMGFTALDGIPMGTRPGQIDPGVAFYLMDQKGMSAAAVQDFFYRECGLKGLSGISNDVRELQSSGDPRAEFALRYFAYRIGLYAGMLAASLEGIDAFVFTAGIGENSPSMRAQIAERLAWLGVSIDQAANSANATLISRSDSRIPVYVIPTDEEAMIARHTLALVAGRRLQTQQQELP